MATSAFNQEFVYHKDHIWWLNEHVNHYPQAVQDKLIFWVNTSRHHINKMCDNQPDYLRFTIWWHM